MAVTKDEIDDALCHGSDVWPDPPLSADEPPDWNQDGAHIHVSPQALAWLRGLYASHPEYHYIVHHPWDCMVLRYLRYADHHSLLGPAYRWLVHRAKQALAGVTPK